MRAVLLVAGQGIRLRPLTDAIPKCLVPYKGRPILDHALERLRECGVDDIVLVRGFMASALEREGVRYRENLRYATTNMVETLFSAEDLLDSDTLIIYGDIVFTTENLRRLISSPAAISVVIDKNWKALWEQRMSDPLGDAETLKLNGDGTIRELGKKPKSYSEIEGQYIGLLKISKEAWPAVRELYHSLDRNCSYDGKSFEQMFMTSFIQLIIDRLMPVTAVPIHGGWVEIDAISDLEVEMQ